MSFEIFQAFHESIRSIADTSSSYLLSLLLGQCRWLKVQMIFHCAICTIKNQVFLLPFHGSITFFRGDAHFFIWAMV